MLSTSPAQETEIACVKYMENNPHCTKLLNIPHAIKASTAVICRKGPVSAGLGRKGPGVSGRDRHRHEWTYRWRRGVTSGKESHVSQTEFRPETSSRESQWGQAKSSEHKGHSKQKGTGLWNWIWKIKETGLLGSLLDFPFPLEAKCAHVYLAGIS